MNSSLLWPLLNLWPFVQECSLASSYSHDVLLLTMYWINYRL